MLKSSNLELQRMTQHVTPPQTRLMMPGNRYSQSPPTAEAAVNQKQKVVVNFGNIQSVRMPQEWRGYERCYMEMGPRIFLQLNAPDKPITLKLALRTSNISKESRFALSQLVCRKPARERAEILLPWEIRSVREVLANVGLNQFSTPGNYAFFLSHAATINVNNRTLLEIHGSFVNRNQTVISCYRGCFWDSDGMGNIQELFIESQPEEFGATKMILKQVLNSIIWKLR
jgi:hypothetical protein